MSPDLNDEFPLRERIDRVSWRVSAVDRMLWKIEHGRRHDGGFTRKTPMLSVLPIPPEPFDDNSMRRADEVARLLNLAAEAPTDV